MYSIHDQIETDGFCLTKKKKKKKEKNEALCH